jgi:hypothetical protein
VTAGALEPSLKQSHPDLRTIVVPCSPDRYVLLGTVRRELKQSAGPIRS